MNCKDCIWKPQKYSVITKQKNIDGKKKKNC